MSKRSGTLGLGERLEVEAALDSAFAPVRARRSTVGPTRIRAAVRWGRAEPATPVGWAAAVRRISELGMAVGMSAFVFAGALTSVPPPGAPLPVSEVDVVDDMLEAPVQAPRHAWIPRIVPDDIERSTNLLIWRLKRDRQPAIEDRIDATIVPAAPAGPAPIVSLQVRMARLFIPVR